MLKRLLLAGVVPALFAVACSGDDDRNASSPVENDEPIDPWIEKWWLEKTAETLWDGAPPSAEELALLGNRSRAEAVDEMLADARFGNAALRINLHLVGWNVPSLYEYAPGGTRSLHHRLAWKPQAVAAALAAVRNGDWFALFSNRAPWVFLPPGRASLVEGEAAGAGLSDADKRARNLAGFEQVLDRVSTMLAEPEGAAAACQVLNTEFFTAGLSLWFFSGFERFDSELGFGNPWTLEYLFPPLTERLPLLCASEQPDGAAIGAELARFRRFLRAAFRVAAEVPEVAPLELGDLALVSDPELGPRPQFSITELFAHPNTSTNMNRKRGAHVLRTYFCDDLTPVAIPAVEGGGSGPHASDPACRACHYKLDPMAGFFRYTDGGGSTDETRRSLLFSDGKRLSGAELEKHLESWRAPAGSGRSWEVGYVRSTTQPQLNSYGDTLADLSAILATAPEVRRCMAQKVAAFFLGAEQTVDSAWLEYLAGKLEPGPQSARGFKEVVREVVLSRAYTTPDANSSRCYDLAPGEEASGVPCVVASLVRENCGGCHNDVSGSGRLDLLRWIDTGGGEMGFPHLDASGAQVPAGETLARMLERITSDNPALVMPRNRHMDSQARQRLYTWLVSEMEGRQ